MTTHYPAREQALTGLEFTALCGVRVDANQLTLDEPTCANCQVARTLSPARHVDYLHTLEQLRLRTSDGVAAATWQPPVSDLIVAARRVARLNPEAGEVGPGMLATIVDEARAALTAAGEEW